MYRADKNRKKMMARRAAIVSLFARDPCATSLGFAAASGKPSDLPGGCRPSQMPKCFANA